MRNAQGGRVEELVEELRHVAEQYGDDYLQPLFLKNPDNRWIVRSGLQKAVRRGRIEEARMCAAYLLADDPSYLFRSLAIVIIEDVGFGDLDLIVWSLAADASKAIRAKVGEARLLAALIARACAA